MKKNVRILAVLAATISFAHAAVGVVRVIVYDHIPNNSVIIQTDDSGPEIQVRPDSVAPGFRGAAQTFKWESDRALSGIAIKTSANQDFIYGNLEMVIVVQEIDPDSGLSLRVVDQKYFIWNTENFINPPSRWINFEFENNIRLQAGKWYGFTISPQVTAIGSQRLRFATSGSKIRHPGAVSQFGLGQRIPIREFDLSQEHWINLTFSLTGE